MTKRAMVLLMGALCACGASTAPIVDGGADAQSRGDAASSSDAAGTTDAPSTSDAASTGVSCNPRAVLCNGIAPSCGPQMVPSVRNGCWGECVPIDECACSMADECPDPSMYTCNQIRRRCTPFL